MNRIILLGNGFDKAHGLKTSYSEFMEWYHQNLKDTVLSCSKTKYSDGLYTFESQGVFHASLKDLNKFVLASNPVNGISFEDIIEYIKENSRFYKLSSGRLIVSIRAKTY